MLLSWKFEMRRQPGQRATLRLPSFSSKTCWLAGEEHRRRCSEIKPPMNRLSVGNVGNHAKRERRAADQDLVGVDAIDILAGNHGPLDLVIIAAAANERNVVHAGERVRNLRAVE